MTSNLERTYFMSWAQAAQAAALIIVVTSFINLRPLLGGPKHTSWTVAILATVLFAVGFTAMYRYFLRVRVSPAGIRGAQARIISWTEITAVVPSAFPRGVIIQSTYAPSIALVTSISRNSRFRQQTLAMISPDHPLAPLLRSSAELEAKKAG